jgi:hypothetical protein
MFSEQKLRNSLKSKKKIQDVYAILLPSTSPNICAVAKEHGVSYPTQQLSFMPPIKLVSPVLSHNRLYPPMQFNSSNYPSSNTIPQPFYYPLAYYSHS